MKQVSVIIPCYNAGKFIQRSVRSVFAQTYGNMEVICVDDGSTDNTLQELEKLRKEFSFSILKQENKGAGCARNAGLRECRGEYVQFLDADDELMPGKIATQMNYIKDSSPDLIISPYIERTGGRSNEIGVSHDAWEGLMSGQAGCTCSNLFSRGFLLQAGGWSENLPSSQEVDIMFRMLRSNASVVFVPVFETIVHRADSFISTRSPAENILRYILIRTSIFDHLQSRGMLSENIRKMTAGIIYGALLRLNKLGHQPDERVIDWLKRTKLPPRKGYGTSAMFVMLCRLLGLKSALKFYK